MSGQQVRSVLRVVGRSLLAVLRAASTALTALGGSQGEGSAAGDDPRAGDLYALRKPEEPGLSRSR